jgi:hypothetical protein
MLTAFPFTQPIGGEMTNMQPFTGTAAFGKAYQYMLERDSHAPGSVDRELARNMVRLCAETAGHLYSEFTPLDIPYQLGSRPELERVVADATPGAAGPEEALPGIVAYTKRLGEHAENDLHNMRLGGTEEQILARGSGWCTDVARVACALCQVVGLPCRIVDLFDLEQAYSGHVIIEAYRAGTWGAADSSTGVVYRRPDGQPATVWDLMTTPALVEAHQGPTAFYTAVGQFRAAGIANYFCWQPEAYDYTVTGLNEYCLSILDMSDQGWPGGLRWLHGEDEGAGT